MALVPLDDGGALPAGERSVMSLIPRPRPRDDGIPNICTCNHSQRTADMCSDCKWCKFEPSWKASLTQMHLKEGEPYLCPIVRRWDCSDLFKVGCDTCAAANLKCAFAQFRVKTPSHLQLCSFARHCESPRHVVACQRLGIDVRLSDTAAKKLAIESNAPEDSKFLWSLTTSFSNSSYQDYKKFIQTEEVQKLAARRALMLDAGVMSCDSDMSAKDGASRTCKTTTCSIAALLDDADQAILRRAVRSSYSVDDADQTRVLKIRCVAANPVVQCHSMVAGVLRDPGHSVEATVEATWEALKQACYVRRGPLDTQTLQGPNCFTDPELVKTIRSTLISAASDGCEVEVQAVPILKRRYCPSLRYFWRDECHTLNCNHQAIIRMQSHQDVALLEILVTGPGSFAKRCQYSRCFRRKWLETQAGSIDEVYELCSCMSYNDTRYHSRSDPMTTFLNKWTSCLSVLILVSRETEPSAQDEVKWACAIISATAGVDGFARMCSFAIEADFFVNCSELVKTKDDNKHKLAVSQVELEEAVERAEALFNECFILDDEPNASYTWRFLDGIRKDHTVHFGKDCEKIAKI